MDTKTKENRRNEENDDENASTTKDVEKLGYYYDDAHGYEVYNPENDDGEDD